MMRKMIIMLAVAGMALSARAQMDETPTQRYSVATASFWSNWFIQADFAVTSFYGDKGNAPAASIPSGSFKDFRTNAGLSVALGKWFTPGLGLSTKFAGLWGRSVVSDNPSTNAVKYWTLNEQLLFNLSNMLAGYSDTRVWNLIPYLSAGVGRSMSHNTYAMGLGLGLLNQWRLTPKLSLNLDVACGIYEPDFDGAGGAVFAKGLPGKDRLLSIGVGLTWNVGSGTFTRMPDVAALNVLMESQLDALNAQLADEQAENARLRQKLNECSSQPQQPVEQ